MIDRGGAFIKFVLLSKPKILLIFFILIVIIKLQPIVPINSNKEESIDFLLIVSIPEYCNF